MVDRKSKAHSVDWGPKENKRFQSIDPIKTWHFPHNPFIFLVKFTCGIIGAHVDLSKIICQCLSGAEGIIFSPLVVKIDPISFDLGIWFSCIYGSIDNLDNLGARMRE